MLASNHLCLRRSTGINHHLLFCLATVGLLFFIVAFLFPSPSPSSRSLTSSEHHNHQTQDEPRYLDREKSSVEQHPTAGKGVSADVDVVVAGHKEPSILLSVPRQLNTGDLVRLMSGGPTMTVCGKVTDKEDQLVKCCWFGGDHLYDGLFPAQVLVPVKLP